MSEHTDETAGTPMTSDSNEPGTAPQPEHTDGALQTRFSDPGLPAHRFRLTDTDERAAKRAERQVAGLFGLSVVGTLIFCVGYFSVQLTSTANVGLSTRLLGGGLGLALFSIGLGAIHWAKKLMTDEEIVEERHSTASTDEERAAAAALLAQGNEESGFGRRKLIRNSLVTALGALGLPAIISLRDLGPLPGDRLEHTTWKEGVRIVTDPTGRPVKAADIPIGGVVHVLPEGIETLEDKAKAAVILIRLEPEEASRHVAKGREDWGYAGIVAYSKICTHVGCPVGLYEQQTHHLLCPCHQSTFDVLNHCEVVFGPAARPLPQLPITVDGEGYLVAQSDFTEPVGPSYWERG
ncbi:MAG TPA: Rieske 2Fe-2S domain-containing protein [Actinomycetes bacterium]|nr:Rieske 2Fe-2S domain-containing protein [Actinomycetes bacterium]